MESTNNPIMDVGSAAEAVSAGDESSSIDPLHEIESLCMRCGENGTTRLLLTRIPHFREVVLMAFECPHCNERNNEVQFAGELQPRGRCYQLQVHPNDDKTIFNRQVVKSDSASIKIPELDFEIPPAAQRGTLSTIEGVISRAINGLEALQEERKKVDPERAEALDQFLIKLKSCVNGDVEFTFVLDDPSGNSFIENPFAPASDLALTITYYERTPEQQESLGFKAAEVADGAPHGSVGAAAFQKAIASGNTEDFTAALFRYSAPEEVMTFPSTCGTCAVPSETRMYVTKIPYFQEVIVMASSCDSCGYRSSELKAGGKVPDKGKRISVQVLNKEDLSRDVIKSDHASVTVPELDLELASGTLGGMVTTIEGLITQIGESLDKIHGFQGGDGTEEWNKSKWKDFKLNLKKLLEVEEPWTLVIDDGLARSFVSPVTEAIEDDRQLVFEDYQRTWEQDEDLGLNDIDTAAADVFYEDGDSAQITNTTA
ncbi:hypothetical protein ACHQM5_001930 [Ranunculus cassubicifolius]